MTANFFMLVFKKSAKCLQRILPICQSVSFACCRRCFRPFGINADHFAGSLFPKNTANLSKCVICMLYGVSGHLASMLLISLDHCFQRILPICQCVICVWQTVFQAIWHQCCSFRWIIVSKEYFQSVTVCHLLVKDGVSGHLASMLLISLDYRAGFLITLSPNRPFASNSLFPAKNYL